MPKNIAILTMSMDIGGAETHIYELSCALAAAGHSVTVFSSGGAYVSKLEEHGIRHITAPMNSKKPRCLIASYRLVAKYIKENPHCILHSHTRISNFSAEFASKRYRVPFVSTVHGKFTTGWLQRIFTKWGLRALCVSDDLRQHTMENYGYTEDRLRVTVNGINLETFKKRSDDEFKKSLGYGKEHKIILCVSRLNDTAADHIDRVISLAEDIYNNDNNTRILIVGDGNRYKELKEKSENINSRTASGFINLVGARTDIYRFCNIADLFIGISRSALEAIACEVPVILLGNYGYIGLLTKATEEACIDTNFTCRGFPFPENKEIAQLASDILASPDKYSESISFGLKLIKERYSVNRMVEDALRTYTEAEKDIRDFDTMICGYYGRSNLGDDILLKAITDNLRKTCKIKKCALLTADPKNNPYGIDVCIHRFNILKIVKYMKRTGTFILGGGSILQDATSSRSLYYYVFITNLAARLGCRTILYGNGIGPINSRKHRRKVAKLLEKMNYITVRDHNSYEYIKELGVSNPRIKVTADEVFTIDTDWASGYDLQEGRKYFCVNLRGANKDDGFYRHIAEAINSISKDYGYVPVLLPLHLDQDIEILRRISKLIECEHILIERQITHQETLAVLKQSSIVLSERLHGLVLSCLFGIPFTAVNYDPKIMAFCLELGMAEHSITDTRASADSIYGIIKDVIESKDSIRDALKDKAQKNRSAAKLNIEIANQIIN